ncbi:hypothetical protein OEZ86_001401 [Tetradesmus obliquus]|nr:hypothetical protein OEZ86_001401 [Tetradesmus obliquus]
MAAIPQNRADIASSSVSGPSGCCLGSPGRHSRQAPAAAVPASSSSRQPGPHPAVMSLQREVSIAQDASAPPEARVVSLSKLHAVMASHQANRPGLAVAMLPWFLAGWPHLVACMWDPNPQLPAAVAPLLGMLLLEVIRMDASVITGAVLRDLLDLLLGWSLEPGLPNRDRQLITRVLSSCKACWLAEPQLVADRAGCPAARP